MKRLSHFDSNGKAQMVDVGAKIPSRREAIACGTVRMNRETFLLLSSGQVVKGDALGAARIAGILAAKKTSDLIPLCHPLPLESIEINFKMREEFGEVKITSLVRTEGKTGVEMEALMAVSVAALTLYDMLKAGDKGIVIEHIHLVRKSGGKSGIYVFKKGNCRQ